MNGFKNFIKSKGFYIALGTGIVAFVSLMMVYNYNSSKDKLSKESGVDLNAPIVEENNNSESVADNSDAEEENVDDVEAGDEETAGNSDAESATDEGAELATPEEYGLAPDNVSTEVGTTEVTDGGVETAEEIEGTDGEETASLTSEESIFGDSEETVQVNTPTADADVSGQLTYNGEKTLCWPYAGNVVLPYSMETTVYFQTLNVYKCNPSILIAGNEGEDVFSAEKGQVKSIEESVEFGTVVTINMGNGYEAKYGQIMNVCVAEGDMVELGENIGEIGPVTSYYKEEGTHLNFSIMKDGEPVNPMELIE